MQFCTANVALFKVTCVSDNSLLHGSKKTMKPGAYMALVVKQEKRVYVTRCAADDYLRENQNKTTNGIFLEYPK